MWCCCILKNALVAYRDLGHGQSGIVPFLHKCSPPWCRRAGSSLRTRRGRLAGHSNRRSSPQSSGFRRRLATAFRARDLRTPLAPSRSAGGAEQRSPVLGAMSLRRAPVGAVQQRLRAPGMPRQGSSESSRCSTIASANFLSISFHAGQQ